GHHGTRATYETLKQVAYWPGMQQNVTEYVKGCLMCCQFQPANPNYRAPLQRRGVTFLWSDLQIDWVGPLPRSTRGNKYFITVVLTQMITDHFTKYAVAVPTWNQKAQTVAKCLWDKFLVYYGFPEKLNSDQGTDFKLRTIKQLCKCAGISKIRTTPYHPRGNPVERFNRTLLQMLGTLNNKEKSRGKGYVKPLVHAYNCTNSDVTGFSPYELMFGRQPRLP
ncbi:hypothetical protein C0J50_15427, partial [Silurus asotus]